MNFRISDSVTWVGKIDWELKKFHGDQLSTNNGTSYNSFLVRDEKNVLIDSVWKPYTDEFIANLQKTIELNKIDYIIANHGEPDHAGALGELLELIPGTPVYCTKSGKKSLHGHFHKDWNFQTVKSGDKLSLGSKEITFFEAPMLHWPDTMMSYLSGDNILFSNDIFGQHIAADQMFDYRIKPDLLEFELMKYFANIIAPFKKNAKIKLDELRNMDLKIDMICPAHGILFKENPQYALKKYEQYVNDYKEPVISVIYESMYGSTALMAETIADGIRQELPGAEVRLMNSAKSDNSDMVTEIFRSAALAVGSPNLNHGIMNSIASILDEIRPMKYNGKKAIVFGSYGWSPGHVDIIEDMLKSSGIEVNDKLTVNWRPDDETLKKCFEFGRKFAKDIDIEFNRQISDRDKIVNE